MTLKFNVVVPTRDRADTLVHCLSTIVAQDYDRLKIIVSDNASTDATREAVDSFKDSRITYLNTTRRISMSKNWEFALSHIDEGWVTFLGDDDGLYPWAIRTLDELISEFEIDAVSAKFGSFAWPGHFQKDGSLAIPMNAASTIKSTKRELRKVFAGTASYNTLPWLYHGGCASLDLINRARHPDGHFFCSQIPDVYSAVALSFSTDRYLRIEKPIAINGASKHSTGTSLMGACINESGIEDAVTRFRSEGNIPFHDGLILGKSLHIMVYESYLQAWHIHQGAPSYSLQEVLKVAVKTAPRQKKEEIRRQCDAIALGNGISYDENAHPSLVESIRNLCQTAGSGYWNVSLNLGTTQVANVADAAALSARVFTQARRRSFLFGVRGYLTARFLERRVRQLLRFISWSLSRLRFASASRTAQE